MKNNIVESVIKKYRNIHGLSRRQLADKLNVSTRLIETYEYGKVVPPLDRLKEIIKTLEIPVEEFFIDILKADGQPSGIESRLLKYNNSVATIELNPELVGFIAFYGKHSDDFRKGKILKLLEKIIKPVKK